MRASKSSPKLLSAALFFGGWTLVGLLFSALSYASAASERRPVSIPYALGMNLTRFYIWAVLSPFIFRFTSRFPIEFRPLRLASLSLHIPVLFLSASFHQALFMTVGWYLEPTFRQRFTHITEFYRAGFLGGFYLNILTASLIVITAQAFLYYRDYQAGQVQQARLKAEVAQARLQALKMQLHPHFLFNTLHSISSLVLEDPPKANSMIARLGDFLRLTLEHSEEQMVTLKQELEFLYCYLEIEQVRFDERLAVAFEVEPATLSANVPHLILQPVVENAIRHAIAPLADPGRIKVEARQVNDRLRLEVKDNGLGIGVSEDSGERQGLGLKNVRARLGHLYGAGFCFEMVNSPEGGLSVILEIPFQPADLNP